MLLSWIATILTIIAIVLNAYKNILCWWVYIVSNILWIVYFWPKQEWAVVMLNIIILCFNLFALRKWKLKKGNG